MNEREFQKWKTARESYPFPPSKLRTAQPTESPKIKSGMLRLMVDGPVNFVADRTQYSSVELDEFHNRLLLSDNDQENLHGILSAYFWGYSAGSDGRPVGYAMRRTRWIVDGRGCRAAQPCDEILKHFKDGRAKILKDDFSGGVEALMKLRLFGLAFASKLAMFICPSKAAVYDKVISENLRRSSLDELKSLYVSTASSARKRQPDTYQRWCEFCLAKASVLNQSGQWRDWNGRNYDWRAVDVERVLFNRKFLESLSEA